MQPVKTVPEPETIERLLAAGYPGTAGFTLQEILCELPSVHYGEAASDFDSASPLTLVVRPSYDGRWKVGYENNTEGRSIYINANAAEAAGLLWLEVNTVTAS